MTLTGERQLTRDRTLTGRDQGGRLTSGWGAPQPDTRQSEVNPIRPAAWRVHLPNVSRTRRTLTGTCQPSAAARAAAGVAAVSAAAAAAWHWARVRSARAARTPARLGGAIDKLVIPRPASTTASSGSLAA